MVEINGTFNAKAAWFMSPLCPKHFYIVGLDDMDFQGFMKTYCVGDIDCKRATGVNLDDTEDKFYMVYVADCYDPPVAIVRADNESQAEEEFVDALDWAHISEPDLKDYKEDDLSFGPSGQPYESASVMVREIKLHRIDF